jgi:hypothetical protein
MCVPMSIKTPRDRSKTYNVERGGYVFYLDEVDEVLAVLSAFGTVVADTGLFKGEPTTAADLEKAHVDTATSLAMSAADASGDGISVELAPAGRLTISNSQNIEVRGAAERIVEVMYSARRRPLPRLLNSSVGILFAMMTVIGGGVLAGVIWDSLIGSRRRLLVMTVASAIASGALVYLRERARPCLFVQSYRANAPTAWERNRESIVIGFAVNIVTSIIFFWLGTRVS